MYKLSGETSRERAATFSIATMASPVIVISIIILIIIISIIAIVIMRSQEKTAHLLSLWQSMVCLLQRMIISAVITIDGNIGDNGDND